MKKQITSLFFRMFLWIFLVLCFSQSGAQNKVDSIQFFIDEKPIGLTIESDFRKLFNTKKETPWQEAKVTLRMPDSTVISEDVQMRARGKFRKTECFMPSLMFNFHNPTSPRLYELDKLKIVSGCGTSTRDEQLVLKEYLAYKLFNIVSPLSFRVRLIRTNFNDSKGKVKKYTTWGFFIEDVDAMAKRNKFREFESVTMQERTNRERMTLVAVFEYFVGNTDWSVANFHNIKLVKPRGDSLAAPYTVPYDFDFAGMVDAEYATPSELIGTTSVTERVYRGFARTMEELMPVINLLKEKRKEFNDLIMGFELLSLNERKGIIKYLDGFYETVENKRVIQSVFIDNARTQ